MAPQAHYEDDVTILAPVLARQLESLEKHIDERLDRIEHQMDGLDVHVREHNRQVEAVLANHAARIGDQERQGRWRWATSAFALIAALIGWRSPQ